MARVIEILGVVEDGSIPVTDIDVLCPTEVPVTVAQGEDVIVKVTVRRSSQALFNLTGSTGVLGIGPDPIDATQQGPGPYVLRPGMIQSPAANGQIWFTLTPSDTLPIKPFAKNSMDIWITQPDTTRSRIILLSPFTVEGAIVIPSAPVTVPATVTVQTSQSGTVAFVAESEKTITIPFPFANTLYSVLVSVNDSVGVYYEKLSASQFKIHLTAPDTCEASWRVAP